MDSEWRDEDYAQFAATNEETTQAQTKHRPLLVVKGALLFSKFDAKGMPLQELSRETVASVEAKFPYVVVMSSPSSLVIAQAARAAFSKPENMHIVTINDGDVHKSIADLLNALRHVFSVSVRSPRDARTLTWLNIEKFIDDAYVTVAGPSDYAKIGIDPEKEPDLNELIRRRSDNDWI